MSATRVDISSDGLKALMGEWARGDGLARGGRVAAAMETAGVDDVRVVVEQHPSRSVVHIGSDDPDALYKEATTGRMARALDAAS